MFSCLSIFQLRKTFYFPTGDPFLNLNGTSTNGIEYSIEAKTFFPSHVNYVYVTPSGEVVLRQPIWNTTFSSLQFIIAVKDRLSSDVDCRTDVTMVVRRNLFAPTIQPGQRTLSEFSKC